MDSIRSYNHYDYQIEKGHEVSQQLLFETVESLRHKDVQPLDREYFLDNLNHQGYISYQIKPPKKDGLYLDSSLYQGLHDAEEMPTRIEFTELPLQAIGREDSRNKVLFGNLYFQNYRAVPDRTLNVAIKPYVGPGAERRTLHEYAMNEYLTGLGVGCPLQLGILKKGANLYTVSEYAPQIFTLDSFDWQNMSDDERKHTIARGLESLVELHKHGVFHGDSEFRNLPIQPERQEEVWAVDFEHAVSLADCPDKLLGEGSILALVRIDLQHLCKSLVDYGMIDPDLSPSDKFQIQYDYVLNQYRSVILHQKESTPFLCNIRSLLDILDELFFAEAQGEIVSEMIRNKNHRIPRMTDKQILVNLL